VLCRNQKRDNLRRFAEKGKSKSVQTGEEAQKSVFKFAIANIGLKLG
jgi:hypothetical protein